ncbi:helix-turn-helix domain-containing protein [Haloterrigena sp. SYSU A558-1]|uniref:Helix-turn-helix domain-containing protein n=1 Tax=Haloterrigena gelatinilytica TaxID=2741724 RepID=A0ABX2L642_9EURY|nr:helix-turn-helix domain-containing protein [Haloterrigena gelatinilytica]NUC71692.1 helix-turn-helix domain-containing protein [Haloterrigena gelatinilytica]
MPSDAGADAQETIEECTPAQKLVYKTLEYADEPLSQTEIAEESHLPLRTVRKALYDLEDLGLVDGRVNIGIDAREKLYDLDK